MSEMLSKNFSLAELTRSDAAKRADLANVPDGAGIEKLKALCRYVLEPVRAEFARPVRVNSGYRSGQVNRLVGGVASSQHVRCEAVDLEVPGISNLAVADWIAEGGLPAGFDQLILEAYTRGQPASGWVHVSWVPNDRRRQVLTMVRQGGRNVYLKGLVA